MALSNLQLNWLRTFEAAGRHLSFSLAAAELNLSQSAVSQQIRLLEQRLGKDLFKRQIRSLQLTSEGRAYLDVVKDGIQRLNTGMNNIFGSDQEDVLDVSINNSFAEFWLAPRIGRFIAQHPRLSIRLFQTNWDFDYPTANAELEIRYGNGRWTGLKARNLLPHKLQPYCSHALANKLRSTDGFMQVSLIDVLGTPSGWRDWKNQHAPETVESVHRYNVDSYAIAASMAIEGIGACLLYEGLVTGSRLEPFLVSPLNAPIECESGYYLATRTDKPLSAAALVFCTWLESELAFDD